MADLPKTMFVAALCSCPFAPLSLSPVPSSRDWPLPPSGPGFVIEGLSLLFDCQLPTRDEYSAEELSELTCSTSKEGAEVLEARELCSSRSPSADHARQRCHGTRSRLITLLNVGPTISHFLQQIKVKACGVCGTDLHIHEGEFIAKVRLVWSGQAGSLFLLPSIDAKELAVLQISSLPTCIH